MYKQKHYLFILCTLVIFFITGISNAYAAVSNNILINQTQNIQVIPCGITIGVKINTNGIIVLGTGKIKTTNGEINPPENLKSGDLILKANGKILANKEELINCIETSSKINLQIKRNNKISDVNITPVKSNDGKNKIGVWVRDSTQGVGTMTYYNPATNKFGALGHGITDIDTQQLMSVKYGDILKTDVISIIKGECGNPGEILGDIRNDEKLGTIKLNNEYGIYGNIYLNKLNNIPSEKMQIQLKNNIHEGPATIRSNIENGTIKNYDAYIETVNRFTSDDSKGMTIRITDKNLLSKTNGIIQGMSGSPIIQDNKLIGAITHVFVHEPSKGYGIFIENMLKQETLI